MPKTTPAWFLFTYLFVLSCSIAAQAIAGHHKSLPSQARTAVLGLLSVGFW